MGVLYGLNPPSVEMCRVLEVGCGDGNNLVPMAVSLPQSEFVCIDLSAVAIEKGKTISAQINLANVRLETLDLLDDLADLGQFDFIIAHGFYSWVPPHVQKRLLSVCDQHLSSNGIAFVSYNTYPGCHLRKAVRDLMLFQIQRSGSGLADRAKSGRSFLETIAGYSSPGTLWQSFLTSELERLSKVVSQTGMWGRRAN